MMAPDLKAQVDKALTRESLVHTDDEAAVQALINLYHGYKNAYEAVSGGQISSDEIKQPDAYDFDGLVTRPSIIRNHDFMSDPKFVEAYASGVDALQYDHKMYWRLHVVLYFANRGIALEGDFVECGVWRGFLSAAIAKYVNWGSVPKVFYLFDTYEGLSEDRLIEEERENADKIAHLNRYFANSYDAAEANFAAYPNVKLVKGFVPDTLTTVDIDRVAYLSLDMNNVSPEIAAAEFFWDRMVPSAPIILDDYGFVSYEPQKRAFNEFAKHRGVEVLHLPTGQGVILKP